MSEQSAEARIPAVDRHIAGQGNGIQPRRFAPQEGEIWAPGAAACGRRNDGHTAQPFLSIEGGLLWPGAGSIDWQVHDDEQWAIIGPNGSGKTVLLRAIAGRRPLAGGRIAYHFAPDGGGAEQVALVEFGLERCLLGLDEPYYGSRWNSPGGSQVPVVSQFLSREAVLGLNPFRLASPAGPAGDGAAYQARQEEVACLLGIKSLLERSLAHLSSGERRRVLLARALLRQPRLLLLDDPFAGLDEAFRPRLAGMIADLMAGPLRVVVAAPGWDSIPPGSTHVLVLGADGHLTSDPSPPRRGEGTPLFPVLLGSRGDLTPGPSLRRSRGHSSRCLGGKRAGETGAVLVQMEGASVRYGGVQVLCGVDWTVRAGERWVLLGPNGAGKTTLLSLILGDNPQAYANRISLFGRRRGSGESIWDIKSRLGWVAPELESYIPPRSSCLDVTCSGFFDSVGLHRSPTPGQRAAAGDVLRRLDLLSLATAPFGALSGGQKRAVLVARALVKSPTLLVLDEPCQGLDAGHRERILSMLDGELPGDRTTLIYVTHDPLALPNSITHLLRLEAGRVVARECLTQVGGERETS